MRFHLIAIGGSIMHNLAIDLQDRGHQVTGSDDEIYDPSKTRLQKAGLYPAQLGWNADDVTEKLDMVILGKHAREDNPELAKAKELDLSIVSFPEFFASHTQASKRVVITGSHGKTTTTSMIMHVLRSLDMSFDYLVGAKLEGFDKMVSLSGADIMVVEGDEYPSSCIDDSAKMMHFNGNISVVTGVAWDHVNIYKTENAYLDLFRDYLRQRNQDEVVFFDQTDEGLLNLVLNTDCACGLQGYEAIETDKKNNALHADDKYPLLVFGEHNFKNLNAARYVCNELGIDDKTFLSQIGSFSGAAKRLEVLHDTPDFKVYRDFAHAPSKAKATTEALRSKYPDKPINCVLELHTFSSLDKSFISKYAQTMKAADQVIVFYDPHALKMKKMPDLDPKYVADSFQHENLVVVTDPGILEGHISEYINDQRGILAFLSSGNLGGVALNGLL